MSKKIERYSFDAYTQILSTYGRSTYFIADEKLEVLPCIMNNWPLAEEANVVITCSGVLHADFQLGYRKEYSTNIQEDFLIPKSSQIILVRLLRKCNHDGVPHYNANDQIIFPEKNGEILRISRSDARDHYIKVSEEAGIIHISDAYRLPLSPSGPIGSYVENGADYPICPIFDINSGKS